MGVAPILVVAHNCQLYEERLEQASADRNHQMSSDQHAFAHYQCNACMLLSTLAYSLNCRLTSAPQSMRTGEGNSIFVRSYEEGRLAEDLLTVPISAMQTVPAATG